MTERKTGFFPPQNKCLNNERSTFSHYLMKSRTSLVAQWLRMWSFVSGFFPLTYCFQNSSMYSICQYFISLYCAVTFHGMDIPHIAIPQITDIWTVSNLGPLWIMLLWTLTYKFDMDVCLHFSWVELLGHMVTLFLTFWEAACFPKRLHYFIFPIAIYESSNFSTPSPTFVIMSFWSQPPSGYEVVSHGFGLHFPND